MTHKLPLLNFQAAALATCQFLATESSRPTKPPSPPAPEPRPEVPSTNDGAPEKPQKIHKHRKKPRVRKLTPPAPPPLVQQLVEMGFTRQHVERALKELAEEVDPRRAEMVVAWLLDHPDMEVRF